MFVSPQSANILGYPPDELPGFAHLVTDDPMNQPAMDASAQAWKTGQAPAPYQLEVLCADRDRVILEVDESPVKDDAGQVAVMVGAARNITQRYRAEQELRRTMNFLNNILKSSADSIAIVDQRGYFTLWNQAAEQFVGYTFEELKATRSFDLYANKNDLDRMMTQLRREGFVRNYEIDLRHKDGRAILFGLSINLLYDDDRKVMGSVCIARDLTKTKETMAQLSAANDQLSGMVGELERRNREVSLLNNMADLLQTCVALPEAYQVVTQFSQELFGAEVGVFYNVNPERRLVELVSSWGPTPAVEPEFSLEACWGLRRGAVHLSASGQPGLACPHLRPAQAGFGLCIPLAVHGEALGLLVMHFGDWAADFLDHLQQLAATVADHVALALSNIRLRETLRQQAMHDPLTGLYNRRFMEEALEREMLRARRHGSTVGIIMADLDYFKRFNDTYGHEAGDLLLKAVGDFLKGHIRGGDIACRYGGEEFILILPESPLETNVARAEKMLHGMQQVKVFYESQVLGPVTLSFGVAVFPQHGDTPGALMRAADMALYQAKQGGRNRVCVAS
jgi:diguanylate cyclase (GGDEF)-like protein/PAS domain S-box-containing protein